MFRTLGLTDINDPTIRPPRVAAETNFHGLFIGISAGELRVGVLQRETSVVGDVRAGIFNGVLGKCALESAIV